MREAIRAVDLQSESSSDMESALDQDDTLTVSDLDHVPDTELQAQSAAGTDGAPVANVGESAIISHNEDSDTSSDK